MKLKFRGFLAFFLLWLALCAALMGGGASVAQAAVSIQNVRIGAYEDKTRLVFDLDRSTSYTAFLLGDPYRLVIDFAEVEWTLPAGSRLGDRGLISDYRYGQFDEQTFRVVLDLTGPVAMSDPYILSQGSRGARLVIDLMPSDDARFQKQSQDILQTLKRPSSRPVAEDKHPVVSERSKNARRLIVIDAGHGGVDPGAIGLHGTYEKNVTLNAARELKAALKKYGHYEVVLTRDKDIFLRLPNRAHIARQKQADLFISLHADHNPNRAARGASVYTLSEKASDVEANRLAQQENKADLIAGIDLGGESPDVTNILLDLAQRETMNMSAKAAQFVVKRLAKQSKLVRNTHRFAGFVVLKSPDVPSVLVELGYLSNPDDEKVLTNKTQRQAVVGAIAHGIHNYFQWRKKLETS